MTPAAVLPPRLEDELDLLDALLPLGDLEIVELGCGKAALARALLARYPGSHVTGLEVDERQHAKNLAAPQPGLHFVAGGAQSIPLPDARFDLALMLKSLHHVPVPLMARALAEVARVLRPGGQFYVSEPVYAGPFNDVVRLFNDEGAVRMAAQQALDEALRHGPWEHVTEHRFTMPAHFADFDDFERRHMHPTFADHHIDETMRARVRAAFQPHCGPDGAHFERPMHIRLLRRRSGG